MLTFVNTVVDSFRRLIPWKAVKLAHCLPVKQIRTVLIVEDEPVDRFIAEHAIRHSGQQEWKAVSFPAAVKALNHLSFSVAHGGRLPEIILLDLMMPDMDGLEFLEALKRLFPHYAKTSRVIVLTVSEDRTQWQRALARGASQIVGKPITAQKWLALCDGNIT